MNQPLLHKLFCGRATDAELTQIRQWLNKNEENKKTFYHERAFFDALLLHDLPTKARVRKRLASHWKWMGSVAAVVVVLFVLNRVQESLTNDFSQEVALNTIQVPAGQRVEITLADGTHLWLNARSELSYPSSFNGKTRKVDLKGEAFFEVAKDENRTFIVNTGRCEVEVLGTQFNVEAYDEDHFTTALLQGSVRVTDKSQLNESVVLEPNNLVRLDHGKLIVTPIVDLNAYSWKEGVIAFKDINFDFLMKKLEHNYGVRIVIDNPNLETYACSGKFRINHGIEEVLRALQQDAHFTFEWESVEQIRIQ